MLNETPKTTELKQEENGATSVVLTPEERKKFENFLKYQHIFQVFVEAKVFETRNGQVVLNFNSQGKMLKIEVKTQVYRSTRLTPPTGDML